MIMKSLVLALLLTGAAAVTANAESFTATSNSTMTSSNSFPSPDGKPVLELNLAFTGQTLMASGKALTNKGTCAEWSTPPGSIFQTNGVCNYTDSGGDTAAILMGCDFSNKDMTEGDCWGGLQGSAGPHAGKSGTISWHFKTAADGKTGTSQNVGQWND
jgi:hypothetical protein